MSQSQHFNLMYKHYPFLTAPVNTWSFFVNSLFFISSYWSGLTCMRRCYPNRQVWQLKSGQGRTDIPLASFREKILLHTTLHVWIFCMWCFMPCGFIKYCTTCLRVILWDVYLKRLLKILSFDPSAFLHQIVDQAEWQAHLLSDFLLWCYKITSG